ncbi:MAG: DNA-processing protein DprA [Bacteroidota bacterium]
MPNSSSSEQLYQIALTLLPNVGDVVAKNLIAYCGSAEAVFKTSKAKLEKIPSIGADRAEGIASADVLKEAEAELKFVEEYKINMLFFTDKEYPQRLKNCNDSPVLLYYKGNADLNANKVVGIVGTRKATAYGKEVTKKLVAELSAQNVLVVSGLAYGIDIASHNAALENNLKTVGVLGHGLNTIYPSQHKPTAKKMVECGGLLTEYTSSNDMHPSNFPNRNRIVAGISDAIVVIESAIKGGAVLTANIANSYNRDVFAFPGKATDKYSAGCNFLIKTFKAKMIESGEDLLTEMSWKQEATDSKSKKQQRQLALILSENEQTIYNLLNEKAEPAIDEIVTETGIDVSMLAATLLEMEMNNIIVSLPGKRYKLI